MNSVSKSPSDRLRVVVLGYIVRGPLGGMAWHHLQYMIGIARLGHDVYFVEDSDDYPSCYDPTRHVTDTLPSYGIRFATYTFDKVGLGDRWVYYDAHTERWLGPCAENIFSILKTADLLLNLSGVNPIRPWFAKIPVRVLIDTDPVFTQIRNLTDPARRAHSSLHTTFFSFGENFGLSHCTVPHDGFPWRATRQPMVLEAWSVTPGPENGKFTTVMLWESYPAREYGGVHYGMKSHSFETFIDLPKKVGRIFELALGGPTAPRDLLRNKGWLVRDPLEPTKDPWTYQNYIQQSRAEFSVAKHGYVVSHSGWFSERSAAYLASGRPTVIQDTGFSEWLKTDAGVISFKTPEEALAGLEEVNRRYEYHCRIAKEVAEEYFNAHRVLTSLVEAAFNTSKELDRESDSYSTSNTNLP